MDNKIENKTITIQKVETSSTKTGGSKLTIVDQDGKRFNFFATKKDGDDTHAYAQFKDMEIAAGSTVRIGYVEETFEMDGKTIRSKKIINFSEASDADRVQEQEPPEAPEPPQSQYEPEPDTENVWEAKDRLHAAQTAANYTASLFQGLGMTVPVKELEARRDEVYHWLLLKKSGTSADDQPPL